MASAPTRRTDNKSISALEQLRLAGSQDRARSDRDHPGQHAGALEDQHGRLASNVTSSTDLRRKGRGSDDHELHLHLSTLEFVGYRPHALPAGADVSLGLLHLRRPPGRRSFMDPEQDQPGAAAHRFIRHELRDLPAERDHRPGCAGLPLHTQHLELPVHALPEAATPQDILRHPAAVAVAYA